ncbi:MAG TPA: sugar dehydrogenase complex small subunit [Gaiellaceae bacterium]
MKPPGNARLTRRGFVVAGAVAIGGVAVSGCGRGKRPVDVGEFVALSRVLTGERQLPVQHAPAYFELLEDADLSMSPSELVRSAGYDGPSGPRDLAALEASGALRSAEAKTCARAIAAAWWSGTVPARCGRVVVTYTDALVWRAMPFAHPPSTCLGATGVWARPPAKRAA